MLQIDHNRLVFFTFVMLLIASSRATSSQVCRNNQPIDNVHNITYDRGEIDIRPNGTVVTYICREGYDLVGENQRTCVSDGVWSGIEPKCEAHDCGQPLPIDNGYQFGPTTTKYNGLVYYTCNPGSVLNGSSVIYCKATGWEAPPSCLDMVDNSNRHPITTTISPSSTSTTMVWSNIMPNSTSAPPLQVDNLRALGVLAVFLILVLVITVIVIYLILRNRRKKSTTQMSTQSKDSLPLGQLQSPQPLSECNGRLSLHDYEDIDQYLPLDEYSVAICTTCNNMPTNQCSAYAHNNMPTNQCSAYANNNMPMNQCGAYNMTAAAEETRYYY